MFYIVDEFMPGFTRNAEAAQGAGFVENVSYGELDFIIRRLKPARPL